MNQIIELQKKCDELSASICSFCKPLMLNKEYKKEITQLLSSEGDLRLAVELSMEVETKKEFFEKKGIAEEEAEIILYTLMKFDESKLIEVASLKQQIKNIIELIKSIK